MSVNRPVDEYALRRLQRSRKRQHDEVEADAKSAGLGDRINGALKGFIHSPTDEMKTNKAALAFMLRRYQELNPDGKNFQAIEKYIPISSAQDMNKTQVFKDYDSGHYYDQELENDVESWLNDNTPIKKSYWDYVVGVGRSAWTIRNTTHHYESAVYKYVLSGGPLGDGWDASFTETKDKNGAEVLGDALANGVSSAADKLGFHPWDDFKKWAAGIPVYVDVGLIVGGAALTYFGLTSGEVGVGITGATANVATLGVIVGPILMGLGAFYLWCHFKQTENLSEDRSVLNDIKKANSVNAEAGASAKKSKRTLTRAPPSSTKQRDYMGNSTLKFPSKSSALRQ